MSMSLRSRIHPPKSGHSTNTRDAALRRLSVSTRWLIAGSVALTGALSEAAAHAFPGKTVKVGARGRAAAKHNSTQGSPSSLAPPATTPQAAPETHTEATPERPAEAAPERQATPEPAPERAPEAAPEAHAEPAPETAPEVRSEPTPEVAAPEAPVVSGGS
jgi:outer membrane biosynthesis protein TonB